jgi:hypothetical protein
MAKKSWDLADRIVVAILIAIVLLSVFAEWRKIDWILLALFELLALIVVIVMVIAKIRRGTDWPNGVFLLFLVIWLLESIVRSLYVLGVL